MDERVYEDGERPNTPRWFIRRFERDNYWIVVTPGDHAAARCLELPDARLIVGALNRVAELEAEKEAAQRLVWRTDEGKRATADQLLERLEARVAALEGWRDHLYEGGSQNGG